MREIFSPKPYKRANLFYNNLQTNSVNNVVKTALAKKLPIQYPLHRARCSDRFGGTALYGSATLTPHIKL